MKLKIHRKIIIGETNLILHIKYHRSDDQILVYLDIDPGAVLVALKSQDSIPQNMAPVACFEPTVRGWDAACSMVQAIHDIAWICRKLELPPGTQLVTGRPTIAGEMHVRCSEAHGYSAYVTSHRCDDKQGEIARLTARLTHLLTLLELPADVSLVDLDSRLRDILCQAREGRRDLERNEHKCVRENFNET